MSRLNISLKGDNYTDKEKKDFWIKINHDEQCPECDAMFSMLKGPRGGLAFNIKCKYCHTVFWLTPFPGFGAYPISVDVPPHEERRLVEDENKGNHYE